MQPWLATTEFNSGKVSLKQKDPLMYFKKIQTCNVQVP